MLASEIKFNLHFVIELCCLVEDFMKKELSHFVINFKFEVSSLEEMKSELASPV